MTPPARPRTPGTGPAPRGRAGPRPLAVVAIHDVAPRTLEPCRRLATRLDGAGVGPLALLVVPAFHGDPPLERGSETGRWLEGRLARGDEVLLHGYRHLAERVPAGLGARLHARLLSAGEAEFLALTESEAAGRLAAGLEVLAAAGLGRPRGFVAPAWLLGQAARRAVARAGFAYTTTQWRLDDLERGVAHRAPALSLSCRTPARTLASRALVPWLWRAARGRPTVRFALHPADAAAPAALALIERLIAEACAGRRLVTYGGALDALREIGSGERGRQSVGSSVGSAGSRPGAGPSSDDTGAPGIA